MTPLETTVRELHAAYCTATGMELPLRFGRDRAWSAFVEAGNTKADLLLVISHLKRGIAREERNAGCLRFRNLIEQLDYFDEELALARKASGARPVAPATKQAVQRIGDVQRTVEVSAAQEPRLPREFVAGSLRKMAEEAMRAGEEKP